MIKNNSIILVDGSYYIYSIYYALPNLVNSLGEPTSVIYGIVNILRNIFIKYKPNYMIVVFDSPVPTFRDRLFSKYKLHRKSVPSDLLVQIPIVYKIIKAIGWPVISIPGVEADDVIGTLSILFSKRDKSSHVYIFSADKDMMQLVTSNIHVMNTRLKILFTVKEVNIKFGISPNLIIDYLSLLGDSSDNVPGVPGIGVVTSKFLLQNLGGIDIIYRNLEIIPDLVGLKSPKSVFLKLKKYRVLAFLSYQLVSIRQDVYLGVSHDDLSLKCLDIDMLLYFFKRYDFKKKWMDALIAGRWLK